jgi:hypothetical protein
LEGQKLYLGGRRPQKEPVSPPLLGLRLLCQFSKTEELNLSFLGDVKTDNPSKFLFIDEKVLIDQRKFLENKQISEQDKNFLTSFSQNELYQKSYLQ